MTSNMDILKILIPLHTMPDTKSFITLFFENLLPVIQNRTKVQIMWLVYTPEKLPVIQQNNSENIILDIHNYKNALDVIQKEKPDIIYASETWQFIDYALSSTAKVFHIPVFCVVYSNIWIAKSATKNMISNLSRFFQDSIPTDTEQQKKKFMRRGRFYIYKYLFMLRTMMVLKKDRLQSLFTIWKFVLSDRLDPRFASETIQFLENESLIKQRLDLGFNKSNLIVTGNPIYDAAFHKMSNQKDTDKKDGIIRVLFAPSTLYEHGFWTSKQREYAVQETVKQIVQNGKEMSLTVKIHPSSSVLSDYKSLIHSIDSSIPVYQKGDIQDFLKDVDVVVSFQSSTAEVYALLSKRPIIICNFFNIQGDVFLEQGLAIDCKEPSSIVSSIHTALLSDLPLEQKRENFIREFMYRWDGRAGERICNKIIELVEKRKVNQ
ncbi:MAG TPA: CDP-glycerol glycerophosphotransferase family protein [Nitrosopumilaceae archaeon]|nr:CDP-glycerol glycerophosphotransferase family protein [Nitrosopumilaceae archaeon]